MTPSESSPASPDSPRFTRGHWIFVGVAVTVVVLAVWLLFPVQVRDPLPPANPPLPAMTAAERSELLSLKHNALGLLENDQWYDAIQVLKEIDAKLPQDSFAARNIAVAMCGKNSFGGTDPRAIQPEEAESAAQRLIQIDPDDFASYLLAGRIATSCQNRDLAMERYRKATSLAPENPVPWFEFFKSYDLGFSKEIPEEPAAAIKKCYELAPRNLIAASDLALILAKTRDPALKVHLEAMAPIVAPIQKFVVNPSTDPMKYLNEALRLLPTAIESKATKDWELVATLTQKIQNVMMLQEMFHADLARLRPHPLDFIQPDFTSAEFQSGVQPLTVPPAIPVDFEPATATITLPGTPLATQLGDYDLDQHLDLFVLVEGKLLVYSNPQSAVKDASAAQTESWELIVELPVDASLTGFILADLDQDVMNPVPKAGQRTLPVAAPPPQDGAKQEGANKVAVPGDGTTICQQADSDLILFGPAGIQIWKNDATPEGLERKFVRAEKTGLEDVRDVVLVCAADFDLEGDLDLIVAQQSGMMLWSNREQFTFKNTSSDSVLPVDIYVRQIIPVDWDRDVDLDFVILGDSITSSGKPESQRGVCGLLRNQLHGKLNWEPSLDGRDPLDLAQVRRMALLDSDSNVSWDLVLATLVGGKLINTRTYAAGDVRMKSDTPLAAAKSDGVLCFDYDNDGFLDLLSWNGLEISILHGSQLQQVDPNAGSSNPAFAAQWKSESRIRDCQIGDLDDDGDLDIVELSEKGIRLMTNQGGNKNHWLKVRLRAQHIKEGGGGPGQSKRVNHQGVGSLVELKTQSAYQPQVATGDVIHFGLGSNKDAELLRVLWTNGVPQGHLNPKGDLEICENQAPKGSCPFAYTWNGEHFEFYTDLLWNAPLGLQFAEGVVAPARAWEYLKIPGEKMQLKDGKHVLQVTEELWEATYFDQIELFAIDHPADVDIYSNEKVGPPQLAEYRIHTVRERHFPVSAVDQKGRDVLPQVLHEDGEFTKTYDVKLRQGLTEQHWLELDLGKFEKSGPVTLFLTGWMYPTETSISVAVSQNPDNAQARPPALWAPDAAGVWKELRPFMGFPGGKTKTIAIDLNDVFVGEDHRLRIVTNMEFYWEQAFYTIGDTPAEMKQTTLKLISADLHYRGLSQHYWKPGNGPDQYDYRFVTEHPSWPPMQGMFTRFGDVRELLTQQDDQLVVIGAGDEIKLTFEPPETPLPAGWKRDYIMHNVGWDKDADLHTLWGQTVEPLPFNAMSGYPFEAHEGPVLSSEYQSYLQKYQTRKQDFSKFWRLVREKTR